MHSMLIIFAMQQQFPPTDDPIIYLDGQSLIGIMLIFIIG